MNNKLLVIALVIVVVLIVAIGVMILIKLIKTRNQHTKEDYIIAFCILIFGVILLIVSYNMDDIKDIQITVNDTELNIDENLLNDSIESGEISGYLNYGDILLLQNFYKSIDLEDDYDSYKESYIISTYGSEESLKKYQDLYNISDNLIEANIELAYKEEKYIELLGDSFGLTDESIKSIYDENPDSYNYCTLTIAEFDSEQDMKSADIEYDTIVDGNSSETSYIHQNLYLSDTSLGLNLKDCKANKVYTSEVNGKYYAVAIESMYDTFDSLKSTITNMVKHTMGQNKLEEELKEYYTNITTVINGKKYKMSEVEETDPN